ncbi:NACHT domain-containing protein [Purpureocillium lavendulum]|uniref:NACHT domain-containing protein n=1 Tax=Purpureocillium lavendulum TaxID=1247861 RepID=A0AB34FJR4_9HYPO|nr:NACHT domain-containing protein [Purpureocillium lavendulum]
MLGHTGIGSGILTSRDEESVALCNLLGVPREQLPAGFTKWQLPFYLDGGQFFITAAAPDAEVGEHEHEDDAVRFIMSGSVYYDGIELNTGDWMYIPKHKRYSLKGHIVLETLVELYMSRSPMQTRLASQTNIQAVTTGQVTVDFFLSKYFDQVGGREKIWKELDRATSRKRLGKGPMSSDSSMTGKTNNAPLTTAAEWTPPAGSWEDEIDSITGFDDENGGKLTVYLAWKNGKKTQHPTAVVYGKCPQKMLQWYEKHVVIIRNAGAKLPEEPECRVPAASELSSIKSPLSQYEEDIAKLQTSLDNVWLRYKTADAHDQAKLQDRVKRHHIDLYLLESNYNSNLEQATSEYEQRTEAVVQRLCDKLIATLGPGRINHSLRGLEPQRLDEYLLGDYSTSAINGAKGVRPTAILETAAGVVQGQDKDTTAATRRGVKRRGVNTTDSETATKRPAIAENGPRLSRRQRKRKSRNIGGYDQDQQAAPEDVIPGNVYLVWERSKMWSAVLLLPIDAMDSVGVPETMETLGLSANPPDCYVVDTGSKRYKWRKGYEDGGPRVAERIYPVMDFDDLHKRRARWVAANELKAYDEDIAQSLDYYPLIQEYLRRRLVKDRSDDERTIFVRGGGVPGPHCDIRLGDIVVSSPSDGKGGVLQYDCGKSIQEQDFQETAFLNQPPTSLRTVVMGFRTALRRKPSCLKEGIDNILAKEEDLREDFERPGATSDRLYRSDFVHPLGRKACTEVCGDDPLRLVQRPQRTKRPHCPMVHYGLIASGNQLMKDALRRDELAAKHKILCFEMEAAGLMNDFPCLVIRGICDYSDTHKNDEWQGYASLAAAVYATALLGRIPPADIEAEKKIGDILSGFHEVAQAQLDVETSQLRAQEDFAKERLSDKEAACHQAFRLTADGSDSTYEWYKGRVEDRVEGTCLWFLEHEHFQSWLKQDSGPLLVSADPGCGKSVLAKYLIDEYLPRSATICYFFFKDKDQNTVRQVLCALLHQLFTHKPSLIKHALKEYLKDGKGLINSTESLWRVLRNAIKDPEAGPVTIVLDALDESEEHEFADLVTEIERQFCSGETRYGKLKYLLTCRPYDQIVSKFWRLLKRFPNVRIPGEQESEIISEEVNRVITHRVDQLSEQKRLSTQIKSHLEKRLKEATHRTYLWVYLVFNYLEKEGFKKTQEGVDESTVAKLPGTVNQAYEQILNKCMNRPMVRKALCIILAASRPLTLSEMNVAVNMDHTSKAIDLEDDKDFQSRLRSWCGLFISIHRGKIYFLHQTAREFLVANTASSTIDPSRPLWRHSIAIDQAHSVLAEVCVTYLNFLNSDVSLSTGVNGESAHFVGNLAFLDYSAIMWGDHFRTAGVKDDHAILPLVLTICNPASRSYTAWFGIYWKSTNMRTTCNFTDLMVASYFDQQAVVKLLLEKGADVKAKDTDYGRTPLSWAAENGHEVTVRLLLDNGPDIEAQDNYGRTPLSLAAAKGHEGVVKLLLEKGADLEAKDTEYGRTPLSWAAKNGHEAVVKLLLVRFSIDPNITDSMGKTLLSWTMQNSLPPLFWAADRGHEAAVKLLLEKGADADAKDNHSQTPLSRAAKNGHEAVVMLLLVRFSIDPNITDSMGRTLLSWTMQNSLPPLFWAADRGHEAAVKLLIEKGADVEAKDNHSQTPLSWAAKKGHEAVVNLLLEKGADIEAEDIYSQTPLSWAAEKGHEAVVKLLLEKGADVDARDKYSRTPLLWAAAMAEEAVVKLLLEKGADVEANDTEYGRTPLLWAAAMGHETVVKLLLVKGADLEAKDTEYGQTPLSWAAENGHEAVVRLLEKEAAVQAYSLAH